VLTITDAGQEFTLSGAGAIGVTVNGAPSLVAEATSTYRYSFAGSFLLGSVEVDFIEGSWGDIAGNLSSVETENFTVAPPVPDVNVWLVPRIVATSSDTSIILPMSNRDPAPFWQIEMCNYFVAVWVRSGIRPIPWR